jgi:hypothetical protein
LEPTGMDRNKEIKEEEEEEEEEGELTFCRICSIFSF